MTLAKHELLSNSKATSKACPWWESEEPGQGKGFKLPKSMLHEIRAAAQYQSSRAGSGMLPQELGPFNLSVVREEIKKMESDEYMSKVLQDRRLQEYVTLRPLMNAGVGTSSQDPASTPAGAQLMIFNEQLFNELVRLVADVRCLRERLFYLNTARTVLGDAIKDVSIRPTHPK